MRTLSPQEIQAVSGGDGITDALFANFSSRPLAQQVTLVLFFPVFYGLAAYVKAGLGG